MRKGWCPRHDKMFEASDGLCPECGTALVDVTGARARDEPRVVITEEETPPDIAEPATVVEAGEKTVSRAESFPVGTPMLAGIAAAIILIAFFVGLAFPRSRGATPAATATPQIRVDRRIGVDRTGAGVRLKLERFSQRGTRVVLRVTVPDQPGVDIGRITSVYAGPEVSSGLVLEGSTLEVRTTVTGFIAEGALLQRPDVPITGIRIMSLESTARGRSSTALDLSRVWPEEAPAGPIASAPRISRTMSDGRTIYVTGLVGWPSFLEMAVRSPGAPDAWAYTDRYTITVGEAPLAVGEVAWEFVSGGEPHVNVRFADCGAGSPTCLSRGIARGVLTIEPLSVRIDGGWRWEVD